MNHQRRQDPTQKVHNGESINNTDKQPSRSGVNGTLKHHSRVLNGKSPSVLANSPSTSKLSHQRRPLPEDPPADTSKSHSQVSRGRHSSSVILVDRVVQLHERLKNIHHFYKTRIEEEKARVSQRNEVFMSIVEEMQRAHNEKAAALRKMAEQAEGEKKDVGLIDERMNEIKGSIDQILKQSADLKGKNQGLQRQINDKAHSLRQREQELGKLKQELMQARNELQGFQRLNLRENKRNKEITAMIDKSVEGVTSKR